MKILVATIGTNGYDKYIPANFESWKNNLVLSSEDTLEFVYFGDHKSLNDSNLFIPIEGLPWPLNTLLRYHYLKKLYELNLEFDYLIFCNANTLVRRKIEFKDLFGVSQFTFVKCFVWKDVPTSEWSLCRNPNSAAYLPEVDSDFSYVIGGLFGGSRVGVEDMIDTIIEWTSKDLKLNYIPPCHDESYLNRYVHDNMNSPYNLLPSRYGSWGSGLDLEMHNPYIYFPEIPGLLEFKNLKYP